MTTKRYLTADQLLRDSFSLGMQILENGYRPSFIVGVWRGGAPVGIAVQELLHYAGIETDHIAIRTSSYTGIEERQPTIRVHGLNYLAHSLNCEDTLLVIDDVHDTGYSLQEIIKQIGEHCRTNHPREIRLATLYYKPNKSKVDFKPDYYLHETDDWLVFPHELEGLSREEILQGKPGIDHIKELLCRYAADD